jgi:hypothetical protein
MLGLPPLLSEAFENRRADDLHGDLEIIPSGGPPCQKPFNLVATRQGIPYTFGNADL